MVKMGLAVLCIEGRFSQIWSHIKTISNESCDQDEAACMHELSSGLRNHYSELFIQTVVVKL